LDWIREQVTAKTPDVSWSLWKINKAIGYAMHCSRSHDTVIRACDAAGNVIETHEHTGDFKEW
jgi:hypothetical protein